MLREEDYRSDSERDADRRQRTNDASQSQAKSRSRDIDIQQELNRLEEMILASPRIPLTGKTLVDEDVLLDQLDAIRLSLPDAFAKALDILGRQEEIVLEAEDYGQQLIDEAERVAARMLNETGIIQQAQREADQIRQQVQQECQQLRQATLDEIDELRESARQELDQMRATAYADCRDIESGADDYADAVLNNLEDQLVTMLGVIQNGRKQLETEVQPQQPPE